MSERLYHDSNGNEICLGLLCVREPAWAANVIRTYEQKLAELERERDEARAQAQRLAEALKETAEGRTKDGLPCWCGSPNYHRPDRSKPWCRSWREALAALRPAKEGT